MGFGRKFFLLAITGLLISAIAILANEPKSSESAEGEKSTKEKFNPGEFIFEHIGDAYSWHITTIKNHPYSLPLPVILYSKHSGFHIFMSSKFHHGLEPYDGFKIANDGPNKGKIIEILTNGEETKPFDFSITKNVVSILFTVLLMIWVFVSIGKRYKKNPVSAPKGLQSFVEPVIIFIRDEVAIPSIGKHHYAKFMPYLLSVFFFIWFNNLLGLVPFIPGGANVTGNISVTFILAIITFFITTFNGNKHYWVDIFNTPGVPWWLKLPAPIIPFIEFIGIFTKPFALMVRLFANIAAGHIIALAFISLIFIFGQQNAAVGYSISILTILFNVFMMFLELLVGFVQAFVFTLLSAVYFGMAVEEHH